MILLDTSVWVDHLREGEPAVIRLLEDGGALGHPWVAGELALGRLARRREILGSIGNLPQATVATAAEVATMVERRALHGSGIGYVDAQLVAATLLTAGACLWTRDRRLRAVAEGLGCAGRPEGARV